LRDADPGQVSETNVSSSGKSQVAPCKWRAVHFGSAVRQAAKAASVALNAAVFDEKFDEATYRRVFAAFEQDRPDGLLVSDYRGHTTNYGTIIEMAAKYRLPAM
jgi:hypothetical protein